MKNGKISVVVPAYNEELAIEENVKEIVKVLKSLERDWELLVINDGSTDKTLEILEILENEDNHMRIISYPVNKGRGFALKKGFRAAEGDYVIATESDLNWGSEIIKRFTEELDKGNSDIVIASPHMKGGKMENVPLFRWLLSFLGNKIFALAIPGKLTMVTGMTRGYRKEVLNSIELEANDKELHVEILSKAVDLGFRVSEIPAILKWASKKSGKPVRKSHFKFKSIWKHLMLSFYVRPYLLFGSIGFLLLLVGIILGIDSYIVSIKEGVSGRPILFATVLFIVVGIQVLVFGFLATQNRDIKRQLTKIQKTLRELKEE
ncbi:MAG: hypothetical protein COU07_03300 [Candidatus Harrisonbacteria bacterium CG10_big_fil_rev_8_21_14_0_10_40_38]|uniref:Glycosyltransferase 2-like domain-containing protein n=1 Tax=Candidatus Harrisonbacteria bacterium CG10_big_fil_rev_8_21_14_0_10_40_38 TaxID=1974583 RepID=A0A2H0UR87_9BACT|nr:MAG: hypothetical protein COU07_03300 [Candidatus Harrisonbacteria bacterium CG10_big_fil_rev_8_21_14_0_10_40_38]